MSENFTFNIVESIGTIAKRKENNLELNVVSWNGGAPKFDIREWNDDHTTMRRGITLTREEAASLAQILQDYFKEI